MPRTRTEPQAGAALTDAEAQDLYAGRPEAFVRARNDLVRSLRAQGRRGAAEAAALLRKPSASAWAVDQLPRRGPADLGALFDVNERLRAILAGEPGRVAGERLRTAMDERARLVHRLTAAAREALQEAGATGNRATLDRVSATLMATATDADGARRVRLGTLDSDLTPGIDLGLTAPAGSAEPAGAKARARDERRAALRRQRAEAAQSHARDLAAAAEAADRAARDAERAASAAAREAASRRAHADAARRAASKARERAEALQDD